MWASKMKNNKVRNLKFAKVANSCLLAFVYLISPLVVIRMFWLELEEGVYDVQADTIAIPIFGFLIVWVLAIPFVIASVFLFMRTRNENWGIFSFNVRRPVISFVTGVYALILAFILCHDFLVSIIFGDILAGFYILLVVYIVLAVRTQFIYFKLG